MSTVLPAPIPHGAAGDGAAGYCWVDGRPAWAEPGWYDAVLRDEVRALLGLPAGPALAAALAALPQGPRCPIDHAEDRVRCLPVPGTGSGIPCACQVVVAAAWQACAGWAAAGEAAALVHAAGPDVLHVDVAPGRQLHDPARDELAPALRHSPACMANRLGAARALVEHPDLHALVGSGALAAWAAHRVAGHVLDLSPADARRVVADVVRQVIARLGSGRCGYTGSDVGRIARAARLRLCPQAEAQGRALAHANRRVLVHPLPKGMAALVAEVAETDAHRIRRRLTALVAAAEQDATAAGGSESRTRDQHRADLLVDLLLGTGARRCGAPDQPDEPTGATGADEGGHRAPPRPDIQVVVRLETLLGLAETPAHVPGLGAIPANVARALAADGRWRAWVADASGAVTATGSVGYVPSPALARLVRAREPHCRFPGCRQPAQRCDLDHAVPWPRGSTSPANLGPLCRRHHNLKTHGAFTLEPDEANGPPGADAGRAADAGWAGDAGRAAHAGGAGAAGGASAGLTPNPGWTWRTPAGITIRGGPEPPIEGGPT